MSAFETQRVRTALVLLQFLESRNAPGVNVSIYSLRLCYVPRAGWTATATHGASRTSSVAGSSPMAMLKTGATAAVAIAVQAAPTTTVSSIVIAATAAGRGMPAADGWPCVHRQLKQDESICWCSDRAASSVQGAVVAPALALTSNCTYSSGAQVCGRWLGT